MNATSATAIASKSNSESNIEPPDGRAKSSTDPLCGPS
jgi:hypothetical protein